MVISDLGCKVKPRTIGFIRIRAHNKRLLPRINIFALSELGPKRLLRRINIYSILSIFVHVIQCSPNVLRVTSTQTWKITSMWKFSFCEHLSSPHWPMSESKFYPQVQILHKCVVSSLWAKPINHQLIGMCFKLFNYLWFLERKKIQFELGF